MEIFADDQSFRSKVTILLDENLFGLKSALRDAGFKIITLKGGMDDDEIIELAEGLCILTKNADDFRDDAVAGDYDIINIQAIKFEDPDKTRRNSTVQKVKKAIRGSRILQKRGNFELVVFDDGTFKLINIII